REQQKLLAYMLADQSAESATPSVAALEQAVSMLPERRTRQARTFPSVTPVDPVVHLVWENAEAAQHGAALERLARRVVRIGHSSSFVSCAFVDTAPAATYVPSDDGDMFLRVPGPGQVARLESAFALHREVEPRVLPYPFQRYAPTASAGKVDIAESVFGNDWIV